MKVLLVFLVALLVVAAWVIFRLARRIERGRRALDAKKAAFQEQLREGGLNAELEYIVEQLDRELAAEGDDDSRAERLQELKAVLLKNREGESAPFDAAAACADVVEAWRRQIPEGEISLTTPSGGPIEIVGNPDLFRWSLRELFSNVLAHGGEWSRIDVEIDARDGAAVLSFGDDGDGPDLMMTSRLYGSFTPRVESEGPGLGLFAVRAIVERMGGSITAGPAEEGGLSHTVRLPLRDAGRKEGHPPGVASHA